MDKLHCTARLASILRQYQLIFMWSLGLTDKKIHYTCIISYSLIQNRIPLYTRYVCPLHSVPESSYATLRFCEIGTGHIGQSVYMMALPTGMRFERSAQESIGVRPHNFLVRGRCNPTQGRFSQG